jgi:SSS family solute:Na+ symporter
VDGTVVTVVKDKSIEALPVFLSQVLPVGVIGIIGAGMLAAFMSTHDSYLLCWASVLVEDVVNPIAGGKLSTRTRLTLARVFIFLIGVFLLAWSLWYPLKKDMLDYLAVTGAIYFTGAFAVLFFGLYWKRASRVGAYLALISGSLAIFGLGDVRTSLSQLMPAAIDFEVTEAHIGLATSALSLLAMIVGSLLFPDRSSQSPPSDQEA